jgi:hypothetical protein
MSILHVEVAHGSELLRARGIQNLQQALNAVHLDVLAVRVLNGWIILSRKRQHKGTNTASALTLLHEHALDELHGDGGLACLLLRTAHSTTRRRSLPTPPLPRTTILYCVARSEQEDERLSCGVPPAPFLLLVRYPFTCLDDCIEAPRSLTCWLGVQAEPKREQAGFVLTIAAITPCHTVVTFQGQSMAQHPSTATLVRRKLFATFGEVNGSRGRLLDSLHREGWVAFW